MIDTHSHLDFPEFDQDREEVISRAFDNGVRAIINVGVDLERSRKSIELAEKHENIFASVGLHPEYFSRAELSENLKLGFRDLAKHEKVVAIGETGLDYFHVTRSIKHETQNLEEVKQNQKAGFIAQINLAKELKLPVLVHCRNAWDDVFEIISEYSQSSSLPSSDTKAKLFPDGSLTPVIPKSLALRTLTKFVLHCYSGGKKDTKKFLELPNVHFSFSGNITYPKPKERADMLLEAVKMIPPERLMLDSDAPLLAPQVFRGKRNEPAYVPYIAEKIAEVKKMSLEEVEKITDESAIKFFGLDLPC